MISKQRDTEFFSPNVLFKLLREKQKNYNVYVNIPLKIMEFITSFVPLKRNQFQESFINNTVVQTDQ